MEKSFPEKVLRGFFLVNAPYSPAAYYAAIIAYACVLTSVIYWLCNGIVA